jgi:F5/8 type C domain-containing protein
MSQATGTTKLIPGPLREVLLLERALQAVEARSPQQAAKIRELAAAADVRMSAAESLAAGDQLAPALVILRDAAHLAAQAVLAARGDESANPKADDGLKRIADLVDRGQLTGAPHGFASACELLGSANRLVFDELPPSEATQRRLDVEATVGWLRGQIEPRSVAQIKWSRALRLASAVGLVVAVVGGLGAWGASKILTPKNLAYGKPVQLSSRRPNCGIASPDGLPPSGLVDGSKSGSYDICTNSEVNAWAVVDLGQVYSLSQAKVYSRDDCCWGMYDLPTALEISTDGANYVEVARQTAAYTAAKPWIVTMGDRPARFVRLRTVANEPRELVLTELEVFGRVAR